MNDARGRIAGDIVSLNKLPDSDAGQEPQNRADAPDEHALKDEHAHDHAVAGAQRLHDGYVALFIEDHHDERPDDVEAGDDDDEEHDDREGDLLHVETGEEISVEILPVDDFVAVKAGLVVEDRRDGIPQCARRIDVLDADFYAGDDVIEVEEVLHGFVVADQKTVVVIVEA